MRNVLIDEYSVERARKNFEAYGRTHPDRRRGIFIPGRDAGAGFTRQLQYLDAHDMIKRINHEAAMRIQRAWRAYQLARVAHVLDARHAKKVRECVRKCEELRAELEDAEARLDGLARGRQFYFTPMDRSGTYRL